jgi:hypothetical protein
MMTSFSRQISKFRRFQKELKKKKKNLFFLVCRVHQWAGGEKKYIFQEKTRWDDEIFFCFFRLAAIFFLCVSFRRL